MTPRFKKIYKSALKNKSFLEAIYEADFDTPPNSFSSDLDKGLFAAIYYGWLVGKYGKEWESNI